MTASFRFNFIFIALVFPVVGQAAPDWSFCAVPVVSRGQVVDPALSVTEIEADLLTSDSGDYLEFIGDVRLERGSQKLTADLLQLDRPAGQISARGNLNFSDGVLSLNAEQIDLSSEGSSGEFSGAEFTLFENHLRGSASKIMRLDENNSELFDVSYTTCDPQQNIWSLNASRLKLDQLDGRGTAYHAVFRVHDIPVFYFPWMQFPIDNRRMSGLLSPTISNSNSHGFQLSLPFYWNLAENYDMTIMPVTYSRRGDQLNTENRYLFERHSGQLQLSWLDDDLTGEQRWYRDWQHKADLGAGIESIIHLRRVSDSDFLEDFDHLQGIESSDYLTSSVNFSAMLGDWSAGMLFEEYQIVNEDWTASSAPYKRLPRISLDRTFLSDDSNTSLDWKNEWVSFKREESITGDRLHVSPVISYALEDSWYFINPALQLDYTSYSLDNNTDDLNSLDRSVPLLSLDSGLFFERVASNTRGWTQTLEPRLYFLYVPYQDQGDIPVFDSALLAESYNGLFVNNRFSGADRIGDTRQVSLGITTRLLDESNKDFFSASIGQAFYAADREVGISRSSIPDTRRKSSLMTVVRYRPAPSWEIKLASVYDQLEKESYQTDISLRQVTPTQVFNMEYHLRKDPRKDQDEITLEQTTLSFAYPVSHRWTAFAKNQYSIKYNMPVQKLLGFAYESCCWGMKLIYEESSDIDFEQVDRAVNFQLTFKGLGGAGKDINAQLEDGILGYQAPF